MQEKNAIPKFVSIVAIVLGCIDLIRGFLHTMLLEFAALNIAGLDLSASSASDMLQLMGVFGVSNTITGVILILLGRKARPLALTMLGLIPASYVVGTIGMRINMASYGRSEASCG